MNPDTYGRHSKQYVFAHSDWPLTVAEVIRRDFCEAHPQRFIMGLPDVDV